MKNNCENRKNLAWFCNKCDISNSMMLLLALFVGIECLSTLGLTYFESEIIDIIACENMENKYLLFTICMMILLCIVQWLSSVYVPFYVKTFFIRKISKVRCEMFHSILVSSTSSVKKLGVGDITVRFSTDILKLERFFTNDMYIAMRRIIMAIGAIVLAMCFNWKLGLLEFALLPIIVFFNIKMNDSLDENYYLLDDYNAEMSNLFYSILKSLKTIKIYKAEKLFEDNLVKCLKRVQNESIKNNRKITCTSNYLIFINLLPTFLHFIVGTLFVYGGKVTLGEFTAFSILRGYVSNCLMYMPVFIPKYSMSVAAARRVNDICELELENNYIESVILDNDIVIKGNRINFYYYDKEVLENCSFSIEANKLNVLVGESGAGKTTLLYIMSGLLKPDTGEIVYNADIIRNMPRENIAFVEQQPYIFAGSILQNITMFDESKIDAAVRIAKELGLHTAVMRLKNKYDTLIGAGGEVTLSGGQLQRICIARACLSDAKIIFMDEPTSALDCENEAEFINILRKMKKSKTLVISSHSIPIISEADNVCYVYKGQVNSVKNA